MTATDDPRRPGRLSRRRALGTLGLGAAGLLAPRLTGAEAAGRGELLAPASAPCSHTGTAGRFGRLFALPEFAKASPDLRAALVELGRPGGLLDANDDLAA